MIMGWNVDTRVDNRHVQYENYPFNIGVKNYEQIQREKCMCVLPNLIQTVSALGMRH